MNITTIVSEFRPTPRPIFRAAPVARSAPVKKPFVPFPVGTVRGPFSCGKGTDPKGGVQFCVQTSRGWVYFIEAAKDEAKAEHSAREFARTAV